MRGMTHSTAIDGTDIALFTDLYELTMADAYLSSGHDAAATFSLFVRRLPTRRNYLIACGLEQVLTYLENLTFSAGDLAYLRDLGRFSEDFLERLSRLRFTGDVDAVPEGTPVFANEPILEVTAPIAEAQIAETFIMNQVTLQTVLASKAARIVDAAAGRPVIDFGARRMHGLDAAATGARAFHIAGVAGTSNVLAARRFGLPAMGTMGHSFIQSYGSELDAFRAFVKRFPDTVLLVDTYDTLAGIDNVIALAKEMKGEFRVAGVRIDSGDLGGLAMAARRKLDAAGLQAVRIILSSGLDEYKVADLVASGVPVDGFGVGTAMGVSDDAPGIDIAYKLCAYDGRGRTKLSAEKPVLPGRKQVFRSLCDGVMTGDVIARAGEEGDGRALLVPVMRDGHRIAGASPDIGAVRARAEAARDTLPAEIRAIAPAARPYPVVVSQALADDHRAVMEECAGGLTRAASAARGRT